MHSYEVDAFILHLVLHLLRVCVTFLCSISTLQRSLSLFITIFETGLLCSLVVCAIIEVLSSFLSFANEEVTKR